MMGVVLILGCIREKKIKIFFFDRF